MPRKSAKPAGESAVIKQRFNIYTMMLLLALIAIITACLMLWFGELSSYSWPPWNTNEANVTSWAVPAPSAPATGASLIADAAQVAAL